MGSKISTRKYMKNQPSDLRVIWGRSECSFPQFTVRVIVPADLVTLLPELTCTMIE
jgi:hypothetical protein